MKNLLLGAALSLLVLPTATADNEKTPAVAKKADEVTVPFLGNEKCPISGRPVDAKKSLKHEGQAVYFCCGNCLAKGKDDAKAMVAKAYAKTVAVKNEKCPISGRPIAEGKGKTVAFQGKEVRVCCGNCEKAFPKSAKVNLAKALNPKLKDAGNKKCPVMDKPVKDDQFVVYKNTIVKICCPGCDKKIKANPKLLDEVVADG